MIPASCTSLAHAYEAFMLCSNNFRHYLHVVARLTIYGPSFTEKTPENAKLFKSVNNLAWCLKLVVEAGGIHLSFNGCRKTTSLQKDPSGLSEHPPLNIVFFGIFEMNPTFARR